MYYIFNHSRLNVNKNKVKLKRIVDLQKYSTLFETFVNFNLLFQSIYNLQWFNFFASYDVRCGIKSPAQLTKTQDLQTDL